MKFVDRFRATASMVTTSGRWNLLPIVNHTQYQLPAVWRLESATLRLPVKRLLPYCKVCLVLIEPTLEALKTFQFSSSNDKNSKTHTRNMAMRISL